MKKRNESKMTMAALMMLAAMAMTSCASSKKINDGSNAGKSSEMGKNEEDLDNSYLVLSDAQQDIVKKNNAFVGREVCGQGCAVRQQGDAFYHRQKRLHLVHKNH